MKKKRTESQSDKRQTLGQYLANQRVMRKMTLRDVEEATDRAVSNAYLSQLEHGRIRQPSPNVLYSLAAVYGAPYEILMEKAGYISEAGHRSDEQAHGRVATFADEPLTEAEEEALLEYLAFLRSRRGGA